ncbi:hypothetical protein [[Clostridium] innocuum]|uniref:hypothetical protein n=1 Tax=Clostridium innocuum TaxID=1522 RepID=UPI00325A1BA3
MKILTNEDKTITVGKSNDDNYILKYHNDFYKMGKKDFIEICDEDKLIFREEIKENPIYAIIMTTAIISALVLYFLRENYVIIDSNFIIANLILFANIFIHELGHILALKLFYRSGKIKVGFKIYFIYPAFYVDTSDSYLLPKYKRIAVYLAGNFMNCIYILICFLFFPALNKYNYIIISTILINFLPIIKSDGYYAMTTFVNKYNSAKSKAKNYIEDTIRGVLMFLFLFLLSKLNIYL